LTEAHLHDSRINPLAQAYIPQFSQTKFRHCCHIEATKLKRTCDTWSVSCLFRHVGNDLVRTPSFRRTVRRHDGMHHIVRTIIRCACTLYFLANWAPNLSMLACASHGVSTTHWMGAGGSISDAVRLYADASRPRGV
jgi:hypothetical protein